jgi:phosphoribosylanthranilate isomerase
MAGSVDASREMARYEMAKGFLLDSHDLGQAGGTGEIFEWARVPAGLGSSLILAGGLSPDNVADAVRCVRPYAVDVSSGVESAKGIKDGDRMLRFIRGVELGDSS